MHRRLKGAFLVILLLAAGAAGAYIYASAALKSRVERAVADQLKGVIGPARAYDVDASGSLAAFARGRLESLRIKGDRVELPGGLTLGQLDATLDGVDFDLQRGTLTGINKVEFAALVGERDLNRYLASAYPDIAGLSISLQERRVTVSARPRIRKLGIPGLRMRAEGVFDIHDGSQLILDLREVNAAGHTAPGIARGLLEDALNPLLDTSTWGINAHLTSVSTTPGTMVLTGQANFVSGRAIR